MKLASPGLTDPHVVHELWRKRADGSEVMIAYLDARPSYCDRGRWRQGIEVGFFRSEMDPGPRYYFDLEAGKSETMAYLRAKDVDVEGASWREAHYVGGVKVESSL